MQFKCSTSIEVNKVEIEFTNRKLSAYGGFSLPRYTHLVIEFLTG